MRFLPAKDFRLHMSGAVYWIGAAKIQDNAERAAFAFRVGIQAILLALKAANRMGDKGAKRVAFAMLNKARAQYRATFA